MVLGAIKVVLYTLLFTGGIAQLWNQEPWWFAANVNFIFHEAGHVLFAVFGEFFEVLGGSIMEILVPTVITLLFIVQRSWFLAAGTSWWCMTAWLSVSLYASSAAERTIPTLTTNVNAHDWHWVLSQTNLLHYDDFIGTLFFCAAVFMLITGAALLTQDPHIKKLMTPYRRGL